MQLSGEQFLRHRLRAASSSRPVLLVVRCCRQRKGEEILSENLPFESYSSKKERDLPGILTLVNNLATILLATYHAYDMDNP